MASYRAYSSYGYIQEGGEWRGESKNVWFPTYPPLPSFPIKKGYICTTLVNL